MLARTRHPEQLPWFVSGRLDRAQAAAIERHLRRCDVCRAEVAALRSMYRSIRMEAPPDHVGAVRLVAYHAGDSQVSDDDRRLIDEHVRSCHTCSADLAALERAEERMRPKHGRRILGAAASVLIVAAVGWQLASWRAPSPASAAIARVIFLPTLRGPSPRLVGAGPWEFEVVLPLHASARVYRARIYRSDDPLKTILEGTLEAGANDVTVPWLVPTGLLRPGHHMLALSPRGGDGSESDVRGFDIAGSR